MVNTEISNREEEPISSDSASVSSGDPDVRPSLYRDVSFWGMTVTQFLGAFNDNLFKQLMLLLALDMASKDRQSLALFVFSVPFVLFSGFAGFLSDRYSKRSVIVLSKIAEIVVMFLGMAAFVSFGAIGFPGLLLVLFFMGTQSAFFGPGKYGILPEMLRQEDLPRANGLILMTTFLAIIFGTAVAGGVKDYFIDSSQPIIEEATHLWLASGVCVLIAVVGTMTSIMIRKVPAATPGLPFRRSMLGISTETRRIILMDRPLLQAICASSMFWLVGGVVHPSVNSLGKRQLLLSDLWTSFLAASMGIGIALGAVVTGKISRGKVDFRLVRLGAWGIFCCLILLSLNRPDGSHLLQFGGSAIALLFLGFFAGMFAIPIQVFLQSRPPEDQKGRMIAVMNQANFTAIMLAAGVYFTFHRIVTSLEWNHSMLFAFTAVLILPVAIFYRPQNEELPPELS